jgi:hypothetical protein
MYFYLPNITDPMYIQYLKNLILAPAENGVKFCKQITIIILYDFNSRLVTFLKFIYLSLYISLIFLFLLCVASSLILLYTCPPSFGLWNGCQLHVLPCSDYPHLYGLEPVTTAVCTVSFDLIILSIARLPMAYAASVPNKLHSPRLKFRYSLPSGFECSINIDVII